MIKVFLFYLSIVLIFFSYFIFIGDPFKNIVLEKWIIALYIYPIVVPILLRLPLFINFHSIMCKNLMEGERDTEAGRVITLTLAGFSFSALFALLVTLPSFEKNCINIQISVSYIVIALFSFVSSFSIESYKHTRWLQHLTLVLEDIGRLSLLATIISLMWVTSLDRLLIYSVCFIFLGAWLFDCLHRILFWNEFFFNQRKYLKND